MNRNDLPEPNAICKICGRPYHKCKRCIELKNRGIHAWKLFCDTIECYGVYNAINNTDSNLTQKGFKEACSVVLPDNRTFTAETEKAISEKAKILKLKDTKNVSTKTVKNKKADDTDNKDVK